MILKSQDKIKMTIKTKWFGKKIQGKTLSNLLKAVGENPRKLLLTPLERWSTRETYGKVHLSPVKEGIKVDLYVFRTDYHTKDDSISADKISHPIGLIGTSSTEELTRSYQKHIQGEIKYKNVSPKRINK